MAAEAGTAADKATVSVAAVRLPWPRHPGWSVMEKMRSLKQKPRLGTSSDELGALGG